jgi:hypothetical protein
VILRRESLARRRNRPPGRGEALERFGTAHFVDDVSIDLQKTDVVAEILDQMIVPDAVE